MNKLIVKSRSPHLSQVITGFLTLRDKGTLDFDIQVSRDDTSLLPSPHYIEAEIEGTKITFDMCDGYNYRDIEKCDTYYNTVDFIFKRSFSSEKNKLFSEENQKKIQPFGFNYHVTHPRNPIDTLTVKQLVKALMGIKMNRYYVSEIFERDADRKKDNIEVIFFTRLWANQKINETRIALVRQLKKHFGSRFTGGIENSSTAIELCSDLIVPTMYTKRQNYLKKMKQSDICVGSTGLHDSIGWKMGEYIAASRAVVHEKFLYNVPGDYIDGQNYLSFTTIDQCLEHVTSLYDDTDALYNMKLANFEYYKAWLRPDSLVKNALKTTKSAF